MSYTIDGHECFIDEAHVVMVHERDTYSVEPMMPMEEVQFMLQLAEKRKWGLVEVSSDGKLLLTFKRVMGYDKLTFTLERRAPEIHPTISAVVSFRYTTDYQLHLEYNVPEVISARFQAGLMWYLKQSAKTLRCYFEGTEEFENAATLEDMNRILFKLKPRTSVNFKPILPLMRTAYGGAWIEPAGKPIINGKVDEPLVHCCQMQNSKNELLYHFKLSFPSVTYTQEEYARLIRLPNRLHEAKRIELNYRNPIHYDVYY